MHRQVFTALYAPGESSGSNVVLVRSVRTGWINERTFLVIIIMLTELQASRRVLARAADARRKIQSRSRKMELYSTPNPITPSEQSPIEKNITNVPRRSVQKRQLASRRRYSPPLSSDRRSARTPSTAGRRRCPSRASGECNGSRRVNQVHPPRHQSGRDTPASAPAPGLLLPCRNRSASRRARSARRETYFP